MALLILAALFLPEKGGAQSFSGGMGDGYATASSFTFTGSYEKFNGGGGDGYAQGMSLNFSYVLDKFRGSAGDGYAVGLSILLKQQSASTQPVATAPGDTADKAGRDTGPRSVIHAYPNPFRDAIMLSLLSTDYQRVSVRMTDMTGRLVYRKDEALYSGTSLLEVRPGPLPPGAYVLDCSFTGPGEAAGMRMVILKSSE